jgi:hypothetical protein
MTHADQLTTAFMIGWFGCLMSAFPIAMLLLLPHDGWGKGEYDKKFRKLELELQDHKNVIDKLIQEQWNEYAPSWPISHYDQVRAKTEELKESKTRKGYS